MGNVNVNYKFNLKTVPTETFRNMDLSKNFRRSEAYSHLGPLMEDIRDRGLQEEPWVLETDSGVLEPIKGFRRLSSILNLKDLYPKGVPIGDGKELRTFDDVKVRVFKGLSEHEKIDLMLDHGQRQGLDKVEMQLAFEKSIGAGYTEKEIVTMLRSLLEAQYPPKRKIDPPTPENYLNYYKGVVQTAKRVFESPDLLRSAWIRKLDGDQSWPTSGELVEMHKAFQKDLEEDKTATVNKKNPGPRFMELWNKKIAAVAEAEANGGEGAKPKQTAMNNRDQTDACRKACDSLCAKRLFDVQLRNIGPENLTIIDKILVELEKNLTEDNRGILMNMGQKEAAPVTTEEKK